jgi:hypothetical protein
LPGIRGRLQWAASLHSPARVNVILNVTPAVSAPGSRPTSSGDLAALLPTLKALSQTGSSSLSEQVELLDLARRRVSFHQNEVQELDWSRLKTSLKESNTASIDVHSLSEPHHDAQFFVSAVRRLLRASEKPSILVVLTKSVAFEAGEDLEPISLESLPACRVFYIRYHIPAPIMLRPFDHQIGDRQMERAGRNPRMGIPMNHNLRPRDVVDQLAATLKPLSPRVFDVQTPEQMTKALAEIGKALLTSEGQSLR